MALLIERTFTLRMRHHLLLHHPRSHASFQSPSFVVLSCSQLFLQLLLDHLGSFPVLTFSPWTIRMPRQRGKPRRGSPWQPQQPHLVLAQVPATSPASSPGSSLSHSSHSSQFEQAPLATSSPPASRLEGLALSDSLLGFPSKPILDRASSSWAPPTIPPNSPASTLAPPEASSTRPPLEASPLLQEPQPGPHSFSDSVPDLQLQDSLAILYRLVFELRQGLDDLQFRMELLDGKTSALLQILSTFQGAFHFTPEATKAIEHTHIGDSSERGIPTRGGDSGQAMHVAMDEEYTPTEGETPGAYVAARLGLHAPREAGGLSPDNRLEMGGSDVDTHEQMEWRGAVVEDEPWDLATHADSPPGWRV